MIKATMVANDGKKILVIGLSHGNLDRLREHGLGGFIKIEGDLIGWPGHEIMITAGETDAMMATALQDFIGQDTKVHVSDKLKSS